MLTLFIRNVVEPVAGRLGTFAAGILTAWGIADPHANAIGLGISAVILVAMDLLTRWLTRKPRP